MRVISWNVNGLKATIQKGFTNIINDLSADIICLQETKISTRINNFNLEGYYEYYNFSKKAGYSGVAIFTKEKPVKVLYGIELENDFEELENFDNEARVITLEYNSFFIVNVYVPSSQLRKDYRLYFDEIFLNFIEKLNQIKDVIICGDFNICHKDIDICNINRHQTIEAFSDEERANFNELLEIGLIDTFRYVHPQMRKYTFWTNDIENRENSEFGWRLDYILVSEYMRKDIRQANILSEIKGSDHCPIEIILKV